MAERQTRLEEAFFLLEVDENVIASHNTACCQTCSHADLSAQLEEQPDKRGYVFWHAQDGDSAIVEHQLYLGFASREGVPEAEIAQTAVSVLRSTGLEVEWDGNTRRRILVHIPEEDVDFFVRTMGAGDDDEGEDDEEGEGGEEHEGEGAADHAGPGCAAAAAEGQAAGAAAAGLYASESFALA